MRCGRVYGLYAGVLLEEMAPGDELGERVGIADGITDGTPPDGAGVGADVNAPAHIQASKYA